MKRAYTGELPAGWEIATERQDDLCGLPHQEHKGAQGSVTQKSVRGTQLRGQHPQTPRKTVSTFACPKTRLEGLRWAFKRNPEMNRWGEGVEFTRGSINATDRKKAAWQEI